jgi:ribose 5-phosphate isomerase B
MELLIASDHAGYGLKEHIKTFFKDRFTWMDLGTFSTESVDYPDFIHPLAKKIENYPDKKGIIICGSGNGASITANKHPNVRAALCWKNEIVVLARKHNDANVLALPARFISEEEALEMVDTFFTTAFEKGRHQKRVDKIDI